jgi:hypothetical protein
MTKNEYVLYEFKGKMKWLFFDGIFVVDPEYQEEFLSVHPTSIMLGGK